MPRFAANLSLMFTELPFLDRFEAAAEAGFGAVEFLFPYGHPPAAIADRLERFGLTAVLFNLPPGDWAAGERGLAALPDRVGELRAGLDEGMRYAAATGTRRLHMMAGLADWRDPAARVTYLGSLEWCADRLAREGIDLLIEPINPRSMPGYFLADVDAAAMLIADLTLPNLKLQFDIFHCQILHGDVTMRLRRLMPMIGHVQVASVPDRHEPGTGELDDAYLFDELDRLGYDGYVGCEYNPRAGTIDGLTWRESHSPIRIPAALNESRRK